MGQGEYQDYDVRRAGTVFSLFPCAIVPVMMSQLVLALRLIGLWRKTILLGVWQDWKGLYNCTPHTSSWSYITYITPEAAIYGFKNSHAKIYIQKYTYVLHNMQFGPEVQSLLKIKRKLPYTAIWVIWTHCTSSCIAFYKQLGHLAVNSDLPGVQVLLLFPKTCAYPEELLSLRGDDTELD